MWTTVWLKKRIPYKYILVAEINNTAKVVMLIIIISGERTKHIMINISRNLSNWFTEWHIIDSNLKYTLNIQYWIVIKIGRNSE